MLIEWCLVLVQAEWVIVATDIFFLLLQLWMTDMYGAQQVPPGGFAGLVNMLSVITRDTFSIFSCISFLTIMSLLCNTIRIQDLISEFSSKDEKSNCNVPVNFFCLQLQTFVNNLHVSTNWKHNFLQSRKIISIVKLAGFCTNLHILTFHFSSNQMTYIGAEPAQFHDLKCSFSLTPH